MTTHLVTQANYMFQLLSQKPCKPKDVAKAANLGCDALNSLVGDPGFQSYVTLLCERRKTENEAVDWITGRATKALEHFSSFLSAEWKVMHEAGLDSQLVEELVQQAYQLIQPIREWRGVPEIIFRDITLARDEACKLASGLDEISKSILMREDEAPDVTKKLVGKVLYMISGAIIIISNAIADTHIISPAFTAVSGALGSGLIGWAITPQ